MLQSQKKQCEKSSFQEAQLIESNQTESLVPSLSDFGRWAPTQSGKINPRYFVFSFYQPIEPASSKNPPFGPSLGKVASLMIILAPS
jgi:hypothetical protein